MKWNEKIALKKKCWWKTEGMLENSIAAGNKLFNCLSQIKNGFSFLDTFKYIILHFAFEAASTLINIYTKFIQFDNPGTVHVRWHTEWVIHYIQLDESGCWNYHKVYAKSWL